MIGGPTRSVLTPDRLHAAYGVRFAVTQVAGTPMVIPLNDGVFPSQTLTGDLAHVG